MSSDELASTIRPWFLRTLELRLVNAAVAASASSPFQDSAMDCLALSICSATWPRPSAAFLQVSAACRTTTGWASVALSSFAS